MDICSVLAGEYAFQLQLHLDTRRTSGFEYEPRDLTDHHHAKQSVLHSSQELARSIPTLAVLVLSGIAVGKNIVLQLGLRVQRVFGVCQVIPQSYQTVTCEPDKTIVEERLIDQLCDMEERAWKSWPLPTLQGIDSSLLSDSDSD
jgi:hypothetical protein